MSTYNIYKKNTRNKILAFILMSVMVFSVTPVLPGVVDAYAADNITAYASAYGWQGTGGQRLQLLEPGGSVSALRSDVTVLQDGAAPNTPYINKIETAFDTAGAVNFEFKTEAGFNAFTESSFKTNNMPYIKIYNEDESTLLAEYSGGTGLLQYRYGGNPIGIQVGVNAGVLPSGDYIIVFGREIMGNNAQKILGVDVKFQFTVSGGEVDPTLVSGVSLSRNTATVTVGQTFDLYADVTPEQALDKTVKWESSDKKIATVNNGKVTALDAGSVDITVTTNSGDFSAKCVLTVKAPGVYDFQTDTPVKIATTPSSKINYVAETPDYINNTADIKNGFNTKQALNFTLSYGGGSSGGQVTADVFKEISMPNIKIVDSQGATVAEYENGTGLLKHRSGFIFGVDADVLEEGSVYAMILTKNVHSSASRILGKDVRFYFTTAIGDDGNGDESTNLPENLEPYKGTQSCYFLNGGLTEQLDSRYENDYGFHYTIGTDTSITDYSANYILEALNSTAPIGFAFAVGGQGTNLSGNNGKSIEEVKVDYESKLKVYSVENVELDVNAISVLSSPIKALDTEVLPGTALNVTIIPKSHPGGNGVRGFDVSINIPKKVLKPSTDYYLSIGSDSNEVRFYFSTSADVDSGDGDGNENENGNGNGNGGNTNTNNTNNNTGVKATKSTKVTKPVISTASIGAPIPEIENSVVTETPVTPDANIDAGKTPFASGDENKTTDNSGGFDPLTLVLIVGGIAVATAAITLCIRKFRFKAPKA